jgi:VRR-NUC domain
VSEAEIKRQICEWLELQRKHCLFFLATGVSASRNTRRSRFMTAGLSDIVGIWKGQPLFIEVKTPKGIVSDAQHDFLDDVVLHGGIAFVARSVEDVVRRLTRG